MAWPKPGIRVALNRHAAKRGWLYGDRWSAGAAPQLLVAGSRSHPTSRAPGAPPTAPRRPEPTSWRWRGLVRASGSPSTDIRQATAGANRAVLLLSRRISELNRPDLPSHRGSAIAILVGSAIAGAVVVAGALLMTEGTASLLQPRGVRAESAAWLHWLMFAMGGGVMALVIGLLAWAVLRARPTSERPRTGITMVVLGGIVLPSVILPVVWAATIGTMAAEARPDRDPVATIDVTGYQWYYEVECQDGETARNELHIPVGEPVRIRVTSGDVIHSFWVPELAGKQDMIPGEIHEIWIEASEPGEYLAICGEFCGLHHAGHQMVVYAGDAGDCGPGGGGGGLCCG